MIHTKCKKMKNILILGKTGMLGSMLYYQFSNQKNYRVFSTLRENTASDSMLNFDVLQNNVSELSVFVIKNKIEYIINAIGVIKPYCKDDDVEGCKKAILVNSNFPYELSKLAKQTSAKVIQIATDCVFSGKEGNYNEDSSHDPLDAYGKTKSLGEVNDKSILNIRCSIIGPEKKAKVSLLEWFLNNRQNSPLNGFLHHKWNGITTLRFAKLIQQTIEKNLFNSLLKESHIYHFVPKYSFNKFEMLVLFNKVFKKNFQINPTDAIGPVVDRTLSTKFNCLDEFSNLDFEKDLIELKEIMDKDFYNN